jgi:uncharacterized protein YdbL (DUF1318 family)
MRDLKGVLGVVLLPLLAACVTINIYFPAAAAEQAADKVIQEVWGTEPSEDQPAPAPEPGSGRDAPPGNPLVWLLQLGVASAHAAEANIDISTPAIQSLEASMKGRFSQLEPYYASGAVGLTQDGLVSLRDPAAVSLKDRRNASQLVAEENRDRNALYRAIAQANGHPEWENDIRDTFARRWVNYARPGWWYQTSGGAWSRK